MSLDRTKQARKLDLMLVDIRKMCVELGVPHKDFFNCLSAEPNANASSYPRKEWIRFQSDLFALQQSIDRGVELRKQNQNRRDLRFIQLKSTITKETDKVVQILCQLKQKKPLKQLNLETQHQQMLVQASNKVAELTKQFQNHVLFPKNAINSEVNGYLTEIHDQRRNRRNQERMENQNNRKHKSKSRNRAQSLGDIEIVERNGQSEAEVKQEEQFMLQVEQNYKEQDEMLSILLDGLNELEQQAHEANKMLQLQQSFLTQTEQKMDENIVRLKSLNRKTQEVLKSSGGSFVWCVRITLLIVFLALIGYISNLIKQFRDNIHLCVYLGQ